MIIAEAVYTSNLVRIHDEYSDDDDDEVDDEVRTTVPS
jgi:hypothetical protein